MDSKKLLSLIKREEGTKLDFKLKLELFCETGKKELTKDICAIANSSGGRGYIIVGVEDKTKNIIGIQENDMFKEEQIQQIITTRCEPPIPIEVDFVEIKNKKIGVISIYDGGQKPYQVRDNGAFYIRRGSTTDVMRKQELIVLLEENLSLTIETCPLIKSSIDILNMELVNRYFSKKGIEINEENKRFLLLSAGIAFEHKEGAPLKCTYGGLLVFSDKNYIYIPNNMIKIINKLEKANGELHIIQGNLLSMIDSAEEKIKEILPKNYPMQAIIEAIKNAVLYREYFDLNKIIEIVIDRNKIIISSPGEFIDENVKGQRTNYNKRNIWLYEKLISLDEKRRFLNSGRGFTIIKNSFKGKGRVKFINSRAEHSFKVILPGIEIK
ncbi:AlbA family DNA-binding domain-containing protein [Clostridium beijerinckii]|uniref:HTH transcriptional regulator n=1 Tax=Clostridium beijerinckii TaxID=1520 RepID=A0AAX0B7C0_CLOBE|nr:RNA-binding domain-containing protein [Clostridium beijerinckii]MBA8932672.1 putative HTH transcriptional regulator [Clostridium beijerinckii]NRT37369.1 putative HTH transcriptional regulator [Clostridium beijerinckii]NRT43197.1 putative HTH transcriptional regulator [Clostridium beijerinckii]NRT91051.1 putative HTH transcriptional regulator [Clostridium beijerinckii]NRU36875.1 putative HTH transcriptional regulator [Clostridium beijerinckii]